MIAFRMPFWLRVVSLIGITVSGTAAGLFGYRYLTRPVTLTVAVGSVDGEAAKVMSAIANELVADNASVRLTIIDKGTAFEAAKAFSAGEVDLAIVRGDVGDLSQAQAVVVMSHMVAMIIAPPGSNIDSMDKLKGRRVGVIGGVANSKIVDVLSKAYDLNRAKVFSDVALPDARKAVQSKEVSALLVVIPLAEKYLSLVRGFFQHGSKALPILIPIDSASAIAESERAYESFELPKGTLHNSPPVPDDDLTTLRTSLYLVAKRTLSADLMANFTQTLMKVRRELLREQPIFAQITAPSTDPDAYLPVHPGAAAFYNSTQQSFMDEYGNYIYLGPMVLGGIASVLAAAWRFLGIGQPETVEGPLDTLYGLARRIRVAANEVELSHIEEQIDSILRDQRALAAGGDDNAIDAVTLNVAAHRLENLVHDRRSVLEKGLAVST